MLTTETLEEAGIAFDKHDDKTIAGTIENNSDTEPFFLIFTMGKTMAYAEKESSIIM